MKVELTKLKIALVYDHLNTNYGGAEFVIQNLLEIFPQADLFSSIYNAKKINWLKNPVKTSFLQQIPILKNHHRLAAWLMPLAFEQLDLAEYDLIISVSGAMAKGVITRANQFHLCYLLTPTRILYSHQEQYQKSQWFLQLPIIKQLFKTVITYLHWWDLVAAHRPDSIIAISQKVDKRCKRYYQRSSELIIYPPVKKISKKINTETKNFYLIIARLVAYKQIDLVIKACAQLKKSLIIVGTGPQEKKLKKLASHLTKNSKIKINLVGAQSEKIKQQLLANCKALILPGIEDFGISALEANNYGKPVILHTESGAAEIIKDKRQGIHLKTLSVKAYQEAILTLEKTKFFSTKIQTNVQNYLSDKFQKEFLSATIKFYKNFIQNML